MEIMVTRLEKGVRSYENQVMREKKYYEYLRNKQDETYLQAIVEK